MASSEVKEQIIVFDASGTPTEIFPATAGTIGLTQPTVSVTPQTTSVSNNASISSTFAAGFIPTTCAPGPQPIRFTPKMRPHPQSDLISSAVVHLSDQHPLVLTQDVEAIPVSELNTNVIGISEEQQHTEENAETAEGEDDNTEKNIMSPGEDETLYKNVKGSHLNIIIHGGAGKKPPTGYEEFECTKKDCGFIFECKEELEKHAAEAHQPKERISCEHCGKDFASKYQLAKHIRGIHLGIRDKKCTIGSCQYVTYDQGMLKKHMKDVHFDERNFKCSQCEYMASRKVAVLNHIKAVHEKIRDFKCEYCDYVSAQKNAVKEHVKVKHLKLKPYKCSECEFCGVNESAVKRHILNKHSDVKKFHCDECDYKTNEKTSFNNHVARVHKGLPRKRRKPKPIFLRDVRLKNLNQEAVRSTTGGLGSIVIEDVATLPNKQDESKELELAKRHQVEIEEEHQERTTELITEQQVIQQINAGGQTQYIQIEQGNQTFQVVTQNAPGASGQNVAVYPNILYTIG